MNPLPSNTRIDWDYPAPGKGMAGGMAKFIGPGATSAEVWVQFGFAGAAGAALLVYALWRAVPWSPVQYVLAVLLAMDMMGGIVTNATSAAKRWYHREGQGAGRHFGFVAVHLVHVFLVAWLFRAMDWMFFGVVSVCLLGAAAIILRVPLYLQRPVAMGLFAFSLPLTLYVLAPIIGLEWFVPFLFLKLLVRHVLREEPYRPATNG